MLAHFARLEDVPLADLAESLRKCRSDLDKISLLKKSLTQYHKELTHQLNDQTVFLVAIINEIVEDLAKIKHISSKVPAEVFELLQTSKSCRKKLTKLIDMFFCKQIKLKDLA